MTFTIMVCKPIESIRPVVCLRCDMPASRKQELGRCKDAEVLLSTDRHIESQEGDMLHTIALTSVASAASQRLV
jgi:hypothetical protein